MVSDVENSHKKHRKRKRHLYNGIRGQMEFYFGDANLSKDRFLKQLVNKDPFVPLDTFLTFNKMKTLVSTVEEIAKALSSSDLLELDETQQKVRRKTPMPMERNVDEKTLYVESIPPKADHDWVRSVFERFGVVTYVSLPKYAKSRKIKEFGFVEFENESSVAKAVKAFAEFHGLLQMQDTVPSELKSVKAFLKEQAEGEQPKTEVGKRSRKRNKCDEPEHSTQSQSAEKAEEPLAKRSKKDADATSKNSADDNGEAASTTATETAEGTADDDDDNSDTDAAPKDKKKRRKKRKKSKKSTDSGINLDAAYYELKILPKRDWKRLRNQYLNLQREEMSKLKRLAWREQQQAMQQAKDNAEAADAHAPPIAKKLKPNESKLPKVNMNFYGAGDEESQAQKNSIKIESKTNPALERTPLYTYAPGLIVEIQFQEPCVTVKEFKVDMRQYSAVKYVDVKEGALHAHLRLETATAADEFIQQIGCTEYKCKVLSGEAESEYWKKIELDREMKLNKKVKVPQKRGREKMKKLVITHLRFDDDDD